jgi:hypothetical protein
MSRDYGEMEKEFIADLKSRTGRDLGEWMAAIDAASLADKNEIIDWLRPQGFTFAHASWLERIHHNGGKPVYDHGTAVPATALPPTPVMPPPSSSQQPEAPATARAAPATSVNADVQALVDRGKAYRPLARMVIDTLNRTVPGTTVRTSGNLIVFGNPELFAALLVSGKGLKLGLALPEDGCTGELAAAGFTGTASAMTRAIVLVDARQVDDKLTALIATADHNVNGN